MDIDRADIRRKECNLLLDTLQESVNIRPVERLGSTYVKRKN